MNEYQINCCMKLINFIDASLKKKYYTIKVDEIIDAMKVFNNEKFNTLEYRKIFDTLYQKINELLNKRRNEVNNFCNLFINYNDSENFTLDALKLLPFRNAFYLKEKIIFNYIYSYEYKKLSYNDFIISWGKELGYSEDIIDLVINFLRIKNIEDDSFDLGSNNGARHLVFDKHNDDTKEELYAKIRKQDGMYYDYVGLYGELLSFYDEINNLVKAGRIDLADKIVFGSVEVGDGLGYDLLSYDPKTSGEVLIEVKATEIEANLFPFTLTKNEYKKMIDISKRVNNKKYYIYRVLVDETSIKKIYIMHYKDGLLVDKAGNKYSCEYQYEDNGFYKVKKLGVHK